MFSPFLLSSLLLFSGLNTISHLPNYQYLLFAMAATASAAAAAITPATTATAAGVAGAAAVLAAAKPTAGDRVFNF